MSLTARPREAWLYLVEIADLGVKVGISRTPLQRIKAHDGEARAYGRRIERTWVSSVPHFNARANEAAIKGDSAREYLDRTFDDCLAQAHGLPMEREQVVAGPTLFDAFATSLFPAYGDWLARESAR